MGKFSPKYSIDEFSIFVKFNDEKYPGLNALFDKAWLGDLSLLKDTEFDIDTLQGANLERVDGVYWEGGNLFWFLLEEHHCQKYF